jgi:hypothetical protein
MVVELAIYFGFGNAHGNKQSIEYQTANNNNRASPIQIPNLGLLHHRRHRDRRYHLAKRPEYTRLAMNGSKHLDVELIRRHLVQSLDVEFLANRDQHDRCY